MTPQLDELRRPRDARTERAIWVTVALSLLVHALVLLGLPRIRLPSLEPPELSDESRSLSVNLAPAPPPPVPPAFARPIPPAPKVRTEPPAATRPRPPPPPVIARKPPAPAPEIPAPRRAVESDDLSSYIEAKRLARATPTPPAALVPSPSSTPRAEDDDARRDRIAAANLASARASGIDQRIRRGSFQLQRVGFDDAEFIFYGWDKDARRNMARLIEVSKGANSDIRIAVVRRIIAIIREQEEGDFLWESPRLGRNLMLSARARDNTRLEEFMMLEFFSGPFPAR